MLPGHCDLPGGQTHAPLAQIIPGAHACQQAPQFWGSRSISTHDPPQFVCPLEHSDVQTPFAQTRSPHWLPQRPQLLTLLASATQTPLQFVWPLGQSLPLPPAVHFPPEHVWPAGHECPQVPQLRASLASTMHAPPQFV